MKRSICLLFLSLLLVAPSLAGTINLTGRAGLYTAPGSTGTSAMYGIGAETNLTENLTVRAAVETTSYTAGGTTMTYMPATVDLIYGQTIANGLRPYAGAGLSYNSVSGGGVSNSTAGCQAEVGISYSFGGLQAGLEYRYMIPDLNHLDRGSSTYNGSMTGQLSQSINF